MDHSVTWDVRALYWSHVVWGYLSLVDVRIYEIFEVCIWVYMGVGWSWGLQGCTKTVNLRSHLIPFYLQTKPYPKLSKMMQDTHSVKYETWKCDFALKAYLLKKRPTWRNNRHLINMRIAKLPFAKKKKAIYLSIYLSSVYPSILA